MTTLETLDDLMGQPHVNVFPGEEPKTVRLTLDAGESVPAHTHPEREIVLYLTEGEIELQVGDRTHDVTAGEVTRFDGAQEISPRAIEASTALLVLASRSKATSTSTSHS